MCRIGSHKHFVSSSPIGALFHKSVIHSVSVAVLTHPTN
jgi:hypothetical protein